MKVLIWKIKYVIAIRRLLRTPIRVSWDMAGSTIESMGSDIDIYTPQEAAEAERDEWIACS